ncbi:MAG: DUF1572 family protein [Acidobacteria bacterium]|nr:DUF1572 family protein [Acidobacteriota bacterium]MDA1234921.1 DUF1572 family protein [Acidobacteriota bacterium]
MATEAALTHEFLRVSRREFQTNLAKIEKAVAKLTAEQVWTRKHEHENSIGNLLLHLAGNVRQWIISGVGGVADDRDRDAEFAQRESIAPETLLARLRETLEEADSTLAAAERLDLLEKRRIQVFEVTLMQAIYHCVEHFSGHTGQIIWVAKNVSGEDLGFYRYLQDPNRPPKVEP